jgi:hypothetical protein
MNISRDIKEGKESADQSRTTVMYPLMYERSEKEYARNAQRSTDAPQSLTAHVPSPFGKARFMEPAPISEGRLCDELAAPSLPPRATILREKENGAQQESENCLIIALHASTCGPSSQRERESGDEVNAHLVTEHEWPRGTRNRHVKERKEGKCDDRSRHTSPPTNQPALVLCAPAYARGLTAPIQTKTKKKRERVRGKK